MTQGIDQRAIPSTSAGAITFPGEAKLSPSAGRFSRMFPLPGARDRAHRRRDGATVGASKNECFRVE